MVVIGGKAYVLDRSDGKFYVYRWGSGGESAAVNKNVTLGPTTQDTDRDNRNALRHRD